jgi:hypothetical protein
VKDKLEKRRLPNAERLLKYARQVSFGVRSGLPRFDKTFSMQGFVGILGEPEACKSVLALQIGIHNAVKGNLVYFVDKELGEDLFLQRLLCSASARCWESWLGLSDREFVEAYCRAVEKVPMLVNHYDTSFETVRNEVEYLCEISKHGQKVLLILDSLQAVCGTSEKMRTGIDLWLEGLDELKMKWRDTLTIITTVEKRRGTYGEATKDAGKESGRIEYKLEQQFDLRASADNQAVIVECTKNRHGPKQGRVVFRKLFESESPTSFIFKLGEEPGV